MYTKDAASQIRRQFWTSFGQYIAPHPSADGLRINWVNYKTGVKHLYFKMDADKDHAYIAIEMAHPDKDIQEMMFDQFQTYKTMLESCTNECWDWQLHTYDNNRIVTRIYKELPNVNIFKQEDWPALISFFKSRIIALDEFWSTAQYGFELFR